MIRPLVCKADTFAFSTVLASQLLILNVLIWSSLVIQSITMVLHSSKHIFNHYEDHRSLQQQQIKLNTLMDHVNFIFDYVTSFRSDHTSLFPPFSKYPLGSPSANSASTFTEVQLPVGSITVARFLLQIRRICWLTLFSN
jgi:hypothetical protein